MTRTHPDTFDNDDKALIASSTVKSREMPSPDEAIESLLADLAKPMWANWTRYDEFIQVECYGVSMDHASSWWTASTTMERKVKAHE